MWHVSNFLQSFNIASSLPIPTLSLFNIPLAYSFSLSFREVSNSKAGKVIPFCRLVIKFVCKSLSLSPPTAPPALSFLYSFPLLHFFIPSCSWPSATVPTVVNIQTYEAIWRRVGTRENNGERWSGENQKRRSVTQKAKKNNWLFPRKIAHCDILKHGALFNNLFYYSNLLWGPLSLLWWWKWGTVDEK